MFKESKDKLKRIMAAEMAINPDNYSYISYINNNVNPVINDISETIKPFCQKVSISNSINSVTLQFSTSLLTNNIIVVEITPDCRLINFDMSSGDDLYYDKTFEIHNPVSDDRSLVWSVLMKFLELRLGYLETALNESPEIQSVELLQTHDSMFGQDTTTPPITNNAL